MKKIKLRGEMIAGGERITSLSILRLVTTNSPNRAIGVDEMRKRVRILDAIDAMPREAEYLMLEDGDADTLSAAIEGFPWSSASKNLLTIIDDVLKAETMPLKAVK
jgi:hypothetical protein